MLPIKICSSVLNPLQLSCMPKCTFLSKFFQGLVFIIIGCQSQDKEPASNFVFPMEAKVTFKDTYTFKEWFEPLRTIPLAVTNPLLSEIRKIVFYEDKIFVLDEYAEGGIFIFDTLGTWLGKISRGGRGPFENEHIEDFAIGDGLVVLVTDDKYLFWYDANNFYLKKKTPLPTFVFAIAHHPKGGWFLSTNQREDNIHADHLLYIDNQGNIQGSLYPIVNGDLVLYGGNWIHPGDGSFLLYSATRDSVIYKVFPNALEPFISLQGIPLSRSGDFAEVKGLRMMNDVMLHVQDKLVFSTLPVMQDGAAQQSVFTNIYDVKEQHLYVYKSFTSDYMWHAMSGAPVAVVQDSLLVWPLYGDGVEAFRTFLEEQKIAVEDVSLDTIARRVLIHTKEADNPVLLLGRFKK